MQKKLMGAAIAASALIAIGSHLGSGSAQAPTAAADPPLIVAQTDQLLPSGSMTDWATYGDHLVVVTVTKERALPATAEEVRAGEGFIPRAITLRVDSVLWSRPGSRSAPASVETDLDGWRFHGTTRTPIRLEGEPMMQVGKQYVLPLLYLSRTARVSTAGWTPLSPDSIVPVANGVLGQGDQVPGRDAAVAQGNRAVRDAYWGGSVQQLATAIASTRPDPSVAGAMSLPPDQRLSRSAQAKATTP